MIIKLEADSYDPLDLSFLLKEEWNKKHNFKLYGASVISATEVVTDNNNWPYIAARPHHQEITFNCDYFEILNDDNNKEEKLKEQKNDDNDEEITW